MTHRAYPFAFWATMDFLSIPLLLLAMFNHGYRT